jgi:hypothetical protein
MERQFVLKGEIMIIAVLIKALVLEGVPEGNLGEIFNMNGRGRMSGFAAGPLGKCICPKCGFATPHQRGVPCFNLKCPKCGSIMGREM